MGFSLFSSSTYDEIEAALPKKKEQKKSTFGNPNPKNYIILYSEQIGEFSLFVVKYPDCYNYEGKKILIYRGRIEDIIAQGSLDPHFSDNEKLHSPIARFIPTDEGYSAARFFCIQYL